MKKLTSKPGLRSKRVSTGGRGRLKRDGKAERTAGAVVRYGGRVRFASWKLQLHAAAGQGPAVQLRRPFFLPFPSFHFQFPSPAIAIVS